MLTVNLTPQQAGLLYEIASDEFSRLSNLYEESTEYTAARQEDAYNALCALRTVREADFYDRAIADENNPFLISKREYLLENHILTVEQLAQQGIR